MMSASMPAADVLDDPCQLRFWQQSGSSSSLQLSCNSIEKTAARYRSDLAGVIDLSSIPMIPIV
jgi:hypothetical protein